MVGTSHRSYFRLLLASGNWAKLPWLIRLYPQLPEDRRETAILHLERRQVGVTAPGTRQNSGILNAMREWAFPAKLRQLLEFSLRTSGYFPDYK